MAFNGDLSGLCGHGYGLISMEAWRSAPAVGPWSRRRRPMGINAVARKIAKFQRIAPGRRSHPKKATGSKNGPSWIRLYSRFLGDCGDPWSSQKSKKPWLWFRIIYYYRKHTNSVLILYSVLRVFNGLEHLQILLNLQKELQSVQDNSIKPSPSEQKLKKLFFLERRTIRVFDPGLSQNGDRGRWVSAGGQSKRIKKYHQNFQNGGVSYYSRPVVHRAAGWPGAAAKKRGEKMNGEFINWILSCGITIGAIVFAAIIIKIAIRSRKG